eukprot:scaffold219610_cov37-Tisochrysis_lutea.AAC.2
MEPGRVSACESVESKWPSEGQRESLVWLSGCSESMWSGASSHWLNSPLRLCGSPRRTSAWKASCQERRPSPSTVPIPALRRPP